MNTYVLQPDKNILKQGLLLKDEEGSVVYEAKVLKQPLFGASEVEFINHISGISEKHSVTKTLTKEVNDLFNEEVYVAKSYFKFDGTNIWDYLFSKNIQIQAMRHGMLGATFQISVNGQYVGNVKVGSSDGVKGLLAAASGHQVECDEVNLDTVFLVAYAISKTDKAETSN